ncbi:MAG: Gfo/Idh/MocA family oxidoreductase [bacterium]
MKKNISVIGCGYWGRNLVRNFHELGALRTVCDIDPEATHKMIEKYDINNSTTNFADILNDKKTEGVVIATPSELHYRIAREAIESGKDVFVEKPMALKVEEGEILNALAVKNNRILMVGHLLEYHPGILKLKEIIDAGDLGKINYIYSNRLNFGKFRTEESILWSFAPHDISVILLLLGENPTEISASGADYVSKGVMDVTVTALKFASGASAHIFVSWLHPYKEQKLIVIGDKKMAVFDDMNLKNKILVYNQKVNWKGRVPVPQKESLEEVFFSEEEPLKLECKHFIECIEKRTTPRTDGNNGLRVLRILHSFQRSLEERGRVISLGKNDNGNVFIHESSFVDPGCEIGEGTKVWHFSHLMRGAKLGKNCNIGQNVFIGENVTIGNNVKIQNNVSLYEGVNLEDDVFCGPSAVFTNIKTPRSHVSRKNEYAATTVGKGATIGANATIMCGVTIGEYAFIGAGTVVTKDVPAYALVYGVPAVIHGWVCDCGVRLEEKKDILTCPRCNLKYKKRGKNSISKINVESR